MNVWKRKKQEGNQRTELQNQSGPFAHTELMRRAPGRTSDEASKHILVAHSPCCHHSNTRCQAGNKMAAATAVDSLETAPSLQGYQGQRPGAAPRLCGAHTPSQQCLSTKRTARHLQPGPTAFLGRMVLIQRLVSLSRPPGSSLGAECSLYSYQTASPSHCGHLSVKYRLRLLDDRSDDDVLFRLTETRLSMLTALGLERLSGLDKPASAHLARLFPPFTSALTYDCSLLLKGWVKRASSSVFLLEPPTLSSSAISNLSSY